MNFSKIAHRAHVISEMLIFLFITSSIFLNFFNIIKYSKYDVIITIIYLMFMLLRFLSCRSRGNYSQFIWDENKYYTPTTTFSNVVSFVKRDFPRALLINTILVAILGVIFKAPLLESCALLWTFLCIHYSRAIAFYGCGRSEHSLKDPTDV